MVDVVWGWALFLAPSALAVLQMRAKGFRGIAVMPFYLLSMLGLIIAVLIPSQAAPTPEQRDRLRTGRVLVASLFGAAFVVWVVTLVDDFSVPGDVGEALLGMVSYLLVGLVLWDVGREPAPRSPA
jgi:fucose permease